MATDFIGYFCEQNKNLFKTNNYFNQQVLLTLFQQMMKEAQEELDDDLKQMVQESLEKRTLYATILVTFANIGQVLSNVFLLGKVMPLCQEGLRSQSWQAQHASLVLIGVLVEDTKKSFLKELKSFMDLILPYLQSPNPRVVYSCLTCLGLLIQEFSPEVQLKYGAQILQQLITITRQDNPKLISLNIRAISCLINFARELVKEDDEEQTQELIRPFNNDLLQSVSLLFNLGVQIGNSKVLCEVLDFTSVYATLIQKEFLVHYQGFMTNIKTLLGNIPAQNVSQEQLVLKEKLLDTASYLLISNKDNQELISKDISDLISHIAGLVQVVSDENSLLKPSLNFFGTISLLSKEQFRPYLNDILTLCSKCLEQKVDIHIEDQETNTDKGDKFQKVSVDLKIFGGKKVISINHSALEIQQSTMSCLQKVLKQFH